MESKAWIAFESSVVNNYAYWVNEEPHRARRMFAAGNVKKKGYTVQEYLYDIMECIHKGPFSKRTKNRLYSELDDVEQFHDSNGTLEEEM